MGIAAAPQHHAAFFPAAAEQQGACVCVSVCVCVCVCVCVYGKLSF